MGFLGYKTWFPLGLHAVLLGYISKTLDKSKMHTEVVTNTQGFNETALYRFYKMVMNKLSNSLIFLNLHE